MNTYQYQVLRFLPDRVSGEFVNLGVVVFDPVKMQLISHFYSKITRTSSFFPTINSRYLSSTIKFLQKEFDSLSRKFNAELPFERIESIDSITKSILPKDDSSLFFTPEKKLLELSIEIAANDLYEQFVLNYVQDDDREYTTDKEVWNNVYKSYFDEFKITEHLTPHKVITAMDTWEFEKAWKNGTWNCFETISFDLVKEESIKDKTYKWSGKLEELKTSDERLHVYLLSKLPAHHPELNHFIETKLGNVKLADRVTVELVSGDNAESFARKIKEEMDQHNK